MFDWLFNEEEIIDVEIVPNVINNTQNENCRGQEDLTVGRFDAYSRKDKTSNWELLSGFEINNKYNELSYYKINFSTAEEAELFAQKYSSRKRDFMRTIERTEREIERKREVITTRDEEERVHQLEVDKTYPKHAVSIY